MGSIKIKDIKIGKRYRKDMGDISELANSIKEQGLLQPVGINDNNELIFGQRRIKAAISLGWEEIEVRRVNVTSILEGELTENEVRKQFNIEERVAIGKAVEDLLGERRGRPEIKVNKGADFCTLKNNTKTGIKTRDIAAQKAGFGSHDTYVKAKTITEKATPEQLKKVNSGECSINAIYKEIKNKAKRKTQRKVYEAKKEEVRQRIETKTNVLPNLILCDPPWRYDFAETTSRKIENQYDTLTVSEMKDLLPKTEPDCILFLWATAPKIREAFELLDLWGFTYKSQAIWDKEIIGSGYWWRGQHEILIVATKGKPSPPLPEFRVSSVFREKRTKHSKKPVCVYEWIEKAFADRVKLEMFCREKRENWLVMGDEVSTTVSLKQTACPSKFRVKPRKQNGEQ